MTDLLRIPIEAVDAVLEEQLPALLAHLAAMQARVAARLAVPAPPRPPAPRPPAPAEWVTVEEVGKRHRKNPTTVRRLITQGKLPNARKMGGEWRIPAADVRAYEATCPAR